MAQRRIPHIFFVMALLLGISGLALSGCGVESYAGVQLATVAITPTTTPQPSPTPDPLAMELPNTLDMNFMETVVSLRYPASWDSNEEGQFSAVFEVPGGGEGAELGYGVSVFVQLSRRFNLDTSMEHMAPMALSAQHAMVIDFNFMPPESALLPDDATAFNWGEHDAALYPWQSENDGTQALSVAVMTANRQRFVVLEAIGPASRWEGFQPLLEGILATLTLDGEALPAADIVAAVEALG